MSWSAFARTAADSAASSAAACSDASCKAPGARGSRTPGQRRACMPQGAQCSRTLEQTEAQASLVTWRLARWVLSGRGGGLSARQQTHRHHFLQLLLLRARLLQSHHGRLIALELLRRSGVAAQGLAGQVGDALDQRLRGQRPAGLRPMQSPPARSRATPPTAGVMPTSSSLAGSGASLPARTATGRLHATAWAHRLVGAASRRLCCRTAV